MAARRPARAPARCAVVGVDCQRELRMRRRRGCWREAHATYPVALEDAAPRWPSAYLVQALPVTYFLNAQGQRGRRRPRPADGLVAAIVGWHRLEGRRVSGPRGDRRCVPAAYARARRGRRRRDGDPEELARRPPIDRQRPSPRGTGGPGQLHLLGARRRLGAEPRRPARRAPVLLGRTEPDCHHHDDAHARPRTRGETPAPTPASAPSRPSSAPLPSFMGLTTPRPRPAPSFTLTEQTGQPVTVPPQPPRVVVLTFLRRQLQRHLPRGGRRRSSRRTPTSARRPRRWSS